MPQLTFTLATADGREPRRLAVEALVIAGWTGRDKAAVAAHVAELAELGVKPPPRTPTYYPVSAARLTTASEIEVVGAESSGEVEFVVLSHGGETYLGVGSDHTDRAVEAYDVTVSKQMCDKPVAPELWRLADVRPHWESLILRSWIVREGRRELYQEGAVTAMLPPDELLAGAAEPGAVEAWALYCGTLPAIGGIRPADRFEYELEDPVLRRSLRHAYAIKILPTDGPPETARP